MSLRVPFLLPKMTKVAREQVLTISQCSGMSIHSCPRLAMHLLHLAFCCLAIDKQPERPL